MAVVVVLFFDLVWICNWRSDTEMKLCLESESKVKIVGAKVEILSPPGIRGIWTLVLHDLAVRGLPERKRGNDFGVLELLLRPDCLGRLETPFGCDVVTFFDHRAWWTLGADTKFPCTLPSTVCSIAQGELGKVFECVDSIYVLNRLLHA